MNTLKRQKDKTLKDELPRLVGAKYATGEEWKILKEMGIPDPLTCLLRNLYAGQEATVRTGHGITDWFQIGKGVRQGCILSPCLLNLHAGYIMRNARLDEAQTGVKIAGRMINNLRYADDTTLMVESEEELKSLLLKVKSEREVTQSCPTLSRPHGLQPTRLLCPWDFPGKCTEVGCHCLLRHMLYVSIYTHVHTYSVHGFLKAKILKWFAIPFSSGPRFVKTLHHDPSILGGPIWHSSEFH